MSGYARESLDRETIGLDAGFLAKPFTPARLASCRAQRPRRPGARGRHSRTRPPGRSPDRPRSALPRHGSVRLGGSARSERPSKASIRSTSSAGHGTGAPPRSRSGRSRSGTSRRAGPDRPAGTRSGGARRPGSSARSGVARVSTTTVSPKNDRRAERDLGLGQDQALGPAALALDGSPVTAIHHADPGRLDERQVDGVVDVAHRVGVGEADLDARAVAEVARRGRAGRARRASGDRGRAARVDASWRRRPARRPCPPRRGRRRSTRSGMCPGASTRNRIRWVWPGRAPASTLASPSTTQSWKTGSSFVNRTTTNAAGRHRHVGRA